MHILLNYFKYIYIFFLLLLLAILPTTLILSPFYSSIVPNIFLCALFYTLLKKIIGIYSIFFLGIFIDFLMNSILGWHVLLFVLLYYFIELRCLSLEKQHVFIIWLQFSGIAFLYYLQIMILNSWNIFVLLSLILGWIFTILIYPFICNGLNYMIRILWIT